VEGRLKFDTWEGQDGSKRSKHRISVETFTFVSGGAASQGSASAPSGGYDDNGEAPAPNHDDIPF